jgi:hypothetical protein
MGGGVTADATSNSTDLRIRSSDADAAHAALLRLRLLRLESRAVDDDTTSIDTANRFRRTT